MHGCYGCYIVFVSMATGANVTHRRHDTQMEDDLPYWGDVPLMVAVEFDDDAKCCHENELTNNKTDPHNNKGGCHVNHEIVTLLINNGKCDLNHWSNYFANHLGMAIELNKPKTLEILLKVSLSLK